MGPGELVSMADRFIGRDIWEETLTRLRIETTEGARSYGSIVICTLESLGSSQLVLSGASYS